jgi:hypothetical protein
MALLTATLNGVSETFPVVHNEPITVRILGGKDGQPLAHLHLVLLGGYDQRDLHDQLFRAEVLTDPQGQAQLPGQLANIPWLQVWVAKKSLCQAKPRGDRFSVELIRRDGLSAPNRCGTAVVEDAPGVFNVFVKGEAGKGALAKILHVKGSPKIPVPTAAPLATPARVDLAQKPAQVEAISPAPQPGAPAVATVLPATPAPVPEEAALKPVESKPVVTAASAIASAPAASPATAPAAAPAPVAVAARSLANGPTKAQRHRPVRRVARRPVSHRARPVPASCTVQHPVAKAALSATSEKSERPSALSTVPVTPVSTPNKAKPAAGVKQTAAASGESKAPPKQE